VSGFARTSFRPGWLAILAMVAHLCVGMANPRTAAAAEPDTPACRCGDACACGEGCACAVAPADPAESRPEVPAPAGPAIKLVSLPMPERGVAPIPAADSGLDRPARSDRTRPVACGQRAIRLRTGICTT